MQEENKSGKQSMLDGIVKKVEVLKEFLKDDSTDSLMKLIICDDQVSAYNSIESGGATYKIAGFCTGRQIGLPECVDNNAPKDQTKQAVFSV